MKKFYALFVIVLCVIFCASFVPKKSSDWISLFDGKSLKDWKVGANAETFKVEDGMIVVNGETAHLFYDGDVQRPQF